MTIQPLGTSTTANGNSNKTALDSAKNVYVAASAGATVTIKNSGGTIVSSFYIPAAGAVSVRKEHDDEIYASSASVHFTKIGFSN